MKTLRKFLLFFFVLIGVITILFILFRWVLDPVQMLAGQRVDTQTLQNIQKELGLHLPIYQQYLFYLNDLSPIGMIYEHHTGIMIIRNFGIKLPYLGISLYYKEPVWDIFLQHIGATIFLATLSVVLAFVMAYYIGKFLYLKNNSYFNLFFNNLTKIFIATPAFILSILLLWFFSIQWNLLPISGYFIQKNPLTLQNEWNFSYLILPMMASSIRPFAIFLQMNMKLLEDENQKEYVKTAKAKGLKLAQIYDFHIFPNIFSTLISVFFTWWATLLSGAFFIEFIFDYPGIGKLLVDSILQNDYPMVSGLCLLSALIFLSINTLNEILVLRYRVQ